FTWNMLVLAIPKLMSTFLWRLLDFLCCRSSIMAPFIAIREPLLWERSFSRSIYFTPGRGLNVVLISPAGFTCTSRAPGGTSDVVVFPPGQRTQSWVGGAGIASTCTAASWDQ